MVLSGAQVVRPFRPALQQSRAPDAERSTAVTAKVNIKMDQLSRKLEWLGLGSYRLEATAAGKN
jgi:hypothetical protein